jgi:putative Mg2+ transporter-C (MgtC) family protein
LRGAASVVGIVSPGSPAPRYAAALPPSRPPRRSPRARFLPHRLAQEASIIPPDDFGAATQEALIRLGAATLGGALVGVNRELRGKPAGMRTHALVALGAALVTLSSVYMASTATTMDSNSVSRAVQGIIAGVGFLGGGVILKTSDRGSVRHLTTAASIWVVACLGIVCGAGQWPLALAALGLTMLVLVIGGPVEAGIRQAVLKRVFRRPDVPGYRRTGTGEVQIIVDERPRADVDNDD